MGADRATASEHPENSGGGDPGGVCYHRPSTLPPDSVLILPSNSPPTKNLLWSAFAAVVGVRPRRGERRTGDWIATRRDDHQLEISERSPFYCIQYRYYLLHTYLPDPLLP